MSAQGDAVAADQNTAERRATIGGGRTVERERPHTGTLRGPADEDDTLGDCCAHGGVVGGVKSYEG